jgi:hypothetical protein
MVGGSLENGTMGLQRLREMYSAEPSGDDQPAKPLAQTSGTNAVDPLPSSSP